MKYYDQLSNLETELIRLETLTSLVSVITSGFENSANYKDLQNSLYHVEESLASANENIRREFDELWSAIRDDSWNESDESLDEPFDESFEEEYNLEGDSTSGSTIESVKYDFKPIDEVMNTWTK